MIRIYACRQRISRRRWKPALLFLQGIGNSLQSYSIDLVGGIVLKKIVMTGGLTTILVLGVVLSCMAYFIGGYFVDLALKRGNADDPKAPPAVFTTAFTATDGLHPSPRPKFEGENWNIASADGLQLTGTHFMPRHRSHQWVILVHGYGCNQQYTWNFAEEYLRHGYEVLTPDLRASGDSEGTYLTMGALESEDIVRWAQKIAAADPEARIVLHGVSMGAATVMLASARELPSNVTAVIEDCGYTSTYEMFAQELHTLFGLPAFPVMDCANFMSKRRTGVSLKEAAPLDAVRNTKVPMLFIHGDADKLVPYSMMQQLYEASGAPVREQLTVPGAGHAVSYGKDHDAYFGKVFGFADQYTRT